MNQGVIRVEEKDGKKCGKRQQWRTPASWIGPVIKWTQSQGKKNKTVVKQLSASLYFFKYHFAPRLYMPTTPESFLFSQTHLPSSLLAYWTMWLCIFFFLISAGERGRRGQEEGISHPLIHFQVPRSKVLSPVLPHDWWEASTTWATNCCLQWCMPTGSWNEEQKED